MDDKKNNIYGIVGTILFHTIIIVILVLFAFKAPTVEFPEPNGIAITFGEEIQGDGQIKPDEIAPQPQEEQIPQKTSTSASEDLDVTTNDNSDAISVRKTTKPTETKRELTQEEKEQLEREKAAEEFRKKQEKLFGSNFSNNPGNSNDGKEDGVQGDKAGSSTNKNSKGSPGNPLGNKDAVYLAKPLNTTNCNKPIELTVKINSQGNVVAITDIETALSEQSCIEAAKTAAKQNRFVSDPTREVRYAKITYDYTVSQR
ncbi:MAG TPA: hypothetical protein P5243_00435 [Bacteroidales bacterium]|jgi:hypothetical protein|nr:hypothetical protein [Bacteroidales bacterium]HRS17942.1 hypothetical protein [Bacteroidales bacterium]